MKEERAHIIATCSSSRRPAGDTDTWRRWGGRSGTSSPWCATANQICPSCVQQPRANVLQPHRIVDQETELHILCTRVARCICVTCCSLDFFISRGTEPFRAARNTAMKRCNVPYRFVYGVSVCVHISVHPCVSSQYWSRNQRIKDAGRKISNEDSKLSVTQCLHGASPVSLNSFFCNKHSLFSCGGRHMTDMKGCLEENLTLFRGVQSFWGGQQRLLRHLQCRECSEWK